MRYIINSADRISRVTSLSSLFGMVINPPVRNLSCAKLKWVMMPNTIYNIRSGVNNNLTFTDTNRVHSLTIPPSSYTIDTLTTEIAALMNSVGSQTYTVAYNQATFKVTISAAAAFTLQFANAGSCAYTLGFVPVNLSAAITYTGLNAVMLDTTCVYIHINEIGGNTYLTDNTAHTFAVPITVDAGEVVVLTSTNMEQEITLSQNSISYLSISLYLRNMELADLNGAEWQMMLEFE
jgi:hypothetical protein